MTLLNVNTAAALYPVTLAEAKAQLRVDDIDEDTLITSLIIAATSAVEEETSRALITQTWDYSMEQPSGTVVLPLNPVASIDSMTYYDTDDAPQSLTVSDFYLFKDRDSACVRPKDGTSWPSCESRLDALTITFIAGDTADNIPQALKQAVLLLVTHWFEFRGISTLEGSAKPIQNTFDFLTSQHKLGWVA